LVFPEKWFKGVERKQGQENGNGLMEAGVDSVEATIGLSL
jgi:hypothetical protein